MKKTKLILGIFVALFLVSFIIAYCFNSLGFLGLCRVGYKIGQGMGLRFCYKPTGFDGRPCDRKTDCGGGECFLVDQNRLTGRGICNDLPYGCHTRINEKGNFNAGEILCID
ncbi:MAG: hypothetical protein V1892_01480 [bacterium]